jgi:hypothetical protein
LGDEQTKQVLGLEIGGVQRVNIGRICSPKTRERSPLFAIAAKRDRSP